MPEPVVVLVWLVLMGTRSYTGFTEWEMMTRVMYRRNGRQKNMARRMVAKIEGSKKGVKMIERGERL
jgi:hypothetical protein